MILTMKILLVSWFLTMLAGIGVSSFLDGLIHDPDRRDFAVGLALFVTAALVFGLFSALVITSVIHYN